MRAGYLRQRERSNEGRGADAFVPVSWDEALTLIVEGLERIKAAHGNEAIYAGSYGWASAGRLHHSPSVLKRFLGLYGGYVDKRGNHSFGAALGVMPYVVGDSDITAMVVPWSSVVEHTDLVVMFGGAHTKNMQIDAGGAVVHENPGRIERAASAGTRFVNVSPARGDAPEKLGARWCAGGLPTVPGLRITPTWKPCRAETQKPVVAVPPLQACGPSPYQLRISGLAYENSFGTSRLEYDSDMLKSSETT